MRYAPDADTVSPTAETGFPGKDNCMKYTKSNLMRGYANKTLTVDLGSGSINVNGLDARTRDYFVGGRALGLYLL